MTCRVCGAPVTLDPRSRREVCSTCGRGPAFCSCAPVAVFEPAWRRWTREHANAKELAA
jgi:hypothetical protein